MKKTIRLLIALLVVAPVFVAGVAQVSHAEAIWEYPATDPGSGWSYDPNNIHFFNPNYLHGITTPSGGKIDLALSNATAGQPQWSLNYSIDGGAFKTLIPASPTTPGQTAAYEHGLNDGFKLALTLTYGNSILTLGGDTDNNGKADAYVQYGPNPSSITIYWDTNHSGIIDSGDKTTSVGVVSSVPIPPSALMLGSGLLGLIGFGVRRQRDFM